MLELARIESFKLRRGLAVKVMAGLTVLYAGLIVGVYKMMEILLDKTGTSLPPTPGVPMTFQMTGLTAFQFSDMYSMLQIFMMVLVASLYSSEYGRSTLKVMLVGGTRRSSLYLSKFLVLAGTLLGYALLGAILITALSAAVNGWGTSFEPIQLLRLAGAAVRVTALNMAYAAMLSLAAMLTKSTGIVIAIGLGIQFSESMVITLLQMGNNAVLTFLSRLLPSGYAVPFAGQTVENAILLRGLGLSAILTAVFLCMGVWLFRKQDIPA
ncbi:MAG TPA: ABC transporter permease [Clostridia bacterium]